LLNQEKTKLKSKEVGEDWFSQSRAESDTLVSTGSTAGAGWTAYHVPSLFFLFASVG